MKHSAKAAICVVASTALLFSSVGAAAAATGRNMTPPKHGGGVGTLATGVSGWAVVDQDGTIARKLNAKTVDALGGGDYRVHFNSNVKGCAYSGNVSLSGDTGTPTPGYITVVSSNGDSKAVYVSVYDSTGANTDIGFTLVVTC